MDDTPFIFPGDARECFGVEDARATRFGDTYTIREETKIGDGVPFIKTPQGWLQICHGKGHNQIYSLFTMLLDLEEPWRVIKRASGPFYRPDMPYETNGFFPSVVFSSGLVTWEDDRVFISTGPATRAPASCRPR